MQVKTYRTKPTKDLTGLNFSQEKIDGFSLETFQQLKVALVGLGAIGFYVALALVRKGVGEIFGLDNDFVELKNLTRQPFFIKDVGKNKAIAAAKILSQHGFFNTTITAYPYRFQETLEMGIFQKPDVVICGVDNNVTRVAASTYCLKNSIPLIIPAVSRDGSAMYCAIQEPGQACFGCILPRAINDESYPCNLPGIIDIIQVVSGVTVYALDTVVMERYKDWNIKEISLTGVYPDSSTTIPRKPDCPICGGQNGSHHV